MVTTSILALLVVAASTTSAPNEQDGTPQLGYTPALITTDAGARLLSVEGVRVTAGPLGVWVLAGGVALPWPGGLGETLEWEASAAFAYGGATLELGAAMPNALGGSDWDLRLWDLYVAGTVKAHVVRGQVVDLLVYAGPSLSLGQVSTTNHLGTARVPHLGVGGVAGASLSATLFERVIVSVYGGARAQAMALRVDEGDRVDGVRSWSPECGANLAVRLIETLTLDLATVVGWMDQLGGGSDRDLVKVYNLGFSWEMAAAPVAAPGGDDARAVR